MNFLWSRPMTIDWSGQERGRGFPLTETDIENSVIKRILRNQFQSPIYEREVVRVKPWWNPKNPFASGNSTYNNAKGTRYIPGLQRIPQYPQLSTLTKQQHFQGIKVLSTQYDIQPRKYPKPTKRDIELFEQNKELYEIEQKDYQVWAKLCWVNGDCIRALHPEPTLEKIYDAQFKLRANEIHSLPQNFTMAAQIPLETRIGTYELQHQLDLISVDVQNLPIIEYPEVMEETLSILNPCLIPEPCLKHPCRFIPPYENSVSVLPLTEMQRELANYAMDNDAEFIASENALQCLLETDRTWKLPVSVVEVICPEGDTQNIVVLGSEFSIQKECATQRTFKAYKHLLRHRFIKSTEKSSQMTTTSVLPSIPSTEKRAATKHLDRIKSVEDNQNSDEDDRLQIDVKEQKNVTEKTNAINKIIEPNSHESNNEDLITLQDLIEPNHNKHSEASYSYNEPSSEPDRLAIDDNPYNSGADEDFSCFGPDYSSTAEDIFSTDGRSLSHSDIIGGSPTISQNKSKETSSIDQSASEALTSQNKNADPIKPCLVSVCKLDSSKTGNSETNGRSIINKDDKPLENKDKNVSKITSLPKKKVKENSCINVNQTTPEFKITSNNKESPDKAFIKAVFKSGNTEKYNLFGSSTANERSLTKCDKPIENNVSKLTSVPEKKAQETASTNVNQKASVFKITRNNKVSPIKPCNVAAYKSGTFETYNLSRSSTANDRSISKGNKDSENNINKNIEPTSLLPSNSKQLNTRASHDEPRLGSNQHTRENNPYVKGADKNLDFYYADYNNTTKDRRNYGSESNQFTKDISASHNNTETELHSPVFESKSKGNSINNQTISDLQTLSYANPRKPSFTEVCKSRSTATVFSKKTGDILESGANKTNKANSNLIVMKPCSISIEHINIEPYVRKRSISETFNNNSKSYFKPTRRSSEPIRTSPRNRKHSEASADATINYLSKEKAKFKPLKAHIKLNLDQSPPKNHVRKLTFEYTAMPYNRNQDKNKTLSDENDYLEVQAIHVSKKRKLNEQTRERISSSTQKSNPDKYKSIENINTNTGSQTTDILNEDLIVNNKSTDSKIHSKTSKRKRSISIKDLFGDESDDDEPIVLNLAKEKKEFKCVNSIPKAVSQKSDVALDSHTDVEESPLKPCLKKTESKNTSPINTNEAIVLTENEHDRSVISDNGVPKTVEKYRKIVFDKNAEKSPLKPCLKKLDSTDSNARNRKRKLSFSDPLTSDPEFYNNELDDEDNIDNLSKATKKQAVSPTYVLRPCKVICKPVANNKCAEESPNKRSGFTKITPESKQRKSIENVHVRRSHRISLRASESDSDDSQNTSFVSNTSRRGQKNTNEGKSIKANTVNDDNKLPNNRIEKVALRRSRRISIRGSGTDSENSQHTSLVSTTSLSKSNISYDLNIVSKKCDTQVNTVNIDHNKLPENNIAVRRSRRISLQTSESDSENLQRSRIGIQASIKNKSKSNAENIAPRRSSRFALVNTADSNSIQQRKSTENVNVKRNSCVAVRASESESDTSQSSSIVSITSMKRKKSSSIENITPRRSSRIARESHGKDVKCDIKLQRKSNESDNVRRNSLISVRATNSESDNAQTSSVVSIKSNKSSINVENIVPRRSTRISRLNTVEIESRKKDKVTSVKANTAKIQPRRFSTHSSKDLASRSFPKIIKRDQNRRKSLPAIKSLDRDKMTMVLRSKSANDLNNIDDNDIENYSIELPEITIRYFSLESEKSQKKSRALRTRNCPYAKKLNVVPDCEEPPQERKMNITHSISAHLSNKSKGSVINANQTKNSLRNNQHKKGAIKEYNIFHFTRSELDENISKSEDDLLKRKNLFGNASTHEKIIKSSRKESTFDFPGTNTINVPLTIDSKTRKLSISEISENSDDYYDINDSEELNLFHFTAANDTDDSDDDEEPTMEMNTEENNETVAEIHENISLYTDNGRPELLTEVMNAEKEIIKVGMYTELENSNANVRSDQITLDTSTLSAEAINDIIGANNCTLSSEDVIGMNSCTCKGTPFEVPPPRSFRKWQVKNAASHLSFNLIVHSSHKVRKGKREMILEPIVEYQPELGATKQSEGRLRALALSLMMRQSAALINVRVAHDSGNVIVIDKMNGDEFVKRHGDKRDEIADRIHTAVNQLRFFKPGQYILVHDSCHGANAMVYSTRAASSEHTLSLRPADVNMPAAQDALLTKIPPELSPALLPYHKHLGILPLAFTHDGRNVKADKKVTAALARAKLPPPAIQWPKKKKKRVRRPVNEPSQAV